MVRRFKVSILSLVIIMTSPFPGNAQDVWVGKDGNIRNVSARALLIDDETMYLATRNEVYRTKDIKDRWESIFTLPSGENEINCLTGKSRNIFIGTKRGLYRSRDFGASWKNVFRTIMPDKNSVLSIEIPDKDPKKVIIGTKRGIFVSEDSGQTWTDSSANLKNVMVRSLASDKDALYAGTDKGVYVRRNGSSGWERLFVNSALEKSGDEEAPPLDEPGEEADTSPSCIKIKEDRIYIGMEKSILYSEDGGKIWSSFPKEGLAGNVNYVLPSLKNDMIWCATTKGVFEFEKDKMRWQELYKGLNKNMDVTQLVSDDGDEKILWAVADKGLYRLEGGRYLADQYADVEKSLKIVKAVFDDEPAFQELQAAAIRYAEVGPEKITNWRREARLKALMPKISFDVDKNRSDTSEIYTSASRDYVVVGPDDETNNFGVSISWELGDLIWSGDQTNIDVRSRLMVQLRNDILDDLRRAYYERKRVQFELMTEPPKDLKARFDKEMRLRELTSQIDDLTGNYLSDKIKDHREG